MAAVRERRRGWRSGRRQHRSLRLLQMVRGVSQLGSAVAGRHQHRRVVSGVALASILASRPFGW